MTQRVVAFLDVLGFKALVQSVPHDDLVRLYGRLQAAALDGSTVWAHQPGAPNDDRLLDVRRRFAHIMMASDSIVVFSDGQKAADATAVIAVVSRLLLEGLRIGMPLRGAITVGDLDLIRPPEDVAESPGPWVAEVTGLIGQGLVDAYSLEGTCDWSGAVLSQQLVSHLQVLSSEAPGTPVFRALQFPIQMIVKVELPVKGRDRRQAGWAVNWPGLLEFVDHEGKLRDEGEVAAAFRTGEHALPDDVARKVSNTVDFFRHVRGSKFQLILESDDDAGTVSAKAAADYVPRDFFSPPA
jgi:hypothetical protein